MGFWEGWWWNELTRPNIQPYIPDVQPIDIDPEALAALKEAGEEAYQEGIRTGEQMRYQEGIRTGEGRKTAV